LEGSKPQAAGWSRQRGATQHRTHRWFVQRCAPSPANGAEANFVRHVRQILPAFRASSIVKSFIVVPSVVRLVIIIYPRCEGV
jgi:hypothetical protein